MRECWRHAPEDRPSFRMLKEELAGMAQSVLADWLRLLLSLLRPAPPAPAQSPSSTASLRPSPAAHPPPATTLPRARRLHAASPVWYYARTPLVQLCHSQNTDQLPNEHTCYSQTHFSRVEWQLFWARQPYWLSVVLLNYTNLRALLCLARQQRKGPMIYTCDWLRITIEILKQETNRF